MWWSRLSLHPVFRSLSRWILLTFQFPFLKNGHSVEYGIRWRMFRRNRVRWVFLVKEKILAKQAKDQVGQSMPDKFAWEKDACAVPSWLGAVWNSDQENKLFQVAFPYDKGFKVSEFWIDFLSFYIYEAVRSNIRAPKLCLCCLFLIFCGHQLSFLATFEIQLAWCKL